MLLEAAGQLLGDGKGRIERILAARSALEERLHDARESELERVVLLGRDEARAVEWTRARGLLAARRSEREMLSWLLRISPHWQERRELIAAIEAVRPPEPELLASFDAAQGNLSAARAAVRALRRFERRCYVVGLTEDILARVGRPFPVEPVRTLDAVHIATVESLGEPPQLITIVTRDQRVRDTARALGYTVE